MHQDNVECTRGELVVSHVDERSERCLQECFDGLRSTFVDLVRSGMVGRICREQTSCDGITTAVTVRIHISRR